MRAGSLLSVANIKAALVGQSCGVARAVQDTNNHKFGLVMHIIHRMITGEGDAETGRKMLARGAAQGEMPERFAVALDPVDEAFRCRFGSFDGDIKPNLGKVGFGGIGQAEGERSANSFLPRAMIWSASKSFTRPAATSARPLSISVLSAANSSI